MGALRPARTPSLPSDLPECRRQCAALPYRLDAEGRPEVLLVTSRRTRRWIIPKGWLIDGLDAAGSAAREAFEEAGVTGDIENAPVGVFTYLKLREKTQALVQCEVEVFRLRVTVALVDWPEARERTLAWFPVAEAAAMVSDDGLGPLILRAFAERP